MTAEAQTSSTHPSQPIRYSWPPVSIIFVLTDGGTQIDLSRATDADLGYLPARERAIATALLEHTLERMRAVPPLGPVTLR